MRILTLCHEAPPIGGGAGAAAIALAEELVRRGHEVDYVTMHHGDLPERERRNGVEITRLACGRKVPELSTTPEKLRWVWAARREVARLLRQGQYDIIHCHFVVPAGLIAYTLRGRGVPYVVTCHGSDIPGYNPHMFGLEHRLMLPLWRRIVLGASALTSPSRSLAHLIAKACGREAPDVQVVPHGFEVERFECSSRDRRILLVSRLVARKGFQHFLQAIEGTDIGFGVDIVGDGPMRPELEALAARTPTPVRFWGWLDNSSDELRSLYERAAIFVFPSSAENFPVTLLEAMDAGLAIITTDCTGCPEVVGDAALLVPPEDPAAIRQALLKLTQSEDLVADLGDAARERIREHFAWSVVAEQYLALFAGAARRHPPEPIAVAGGGGVMPPATASRSLPAVTADKGASAPRCTPTGTVQAIGALNSVPRLSEPELWVLIGCDCDPDTPARGGASYDSRQPLRWRGISDGLAHFGEVRRGLARELPQSLVKVTWCVRADQQIRELHGSYAWAYTAFETTWRQLSDQGDEIGWHPHVWRWSEDASVWYQEAEDESWSSGWLPDAHEALSEAVGHPVRVARTGWEYHSNASMRIFADLGLTLDFSAVPGRRTPGFRVADSDHIHEFEDWSLSPEHPYRPSAADYRRPARPGEEQLDIWEVPKAAFRSRFWRAMSAARSAVRALRTGEPGKVFAGPAWHSQLNTAGLATHPRIFRYVASQKIAEAAREGRSLLSTSFHADELLATGPAGTKLTDASHLTTNLRGLLTMAERRGVRVSFVTASEVHAALSEDPAAFGAHLAAADAAGGQAPSDRSASGPRNRRQGI